MTAINISQSISQTPNASGQFTVTVEGFVTGTATSTSIDKASDITLLLDLSKREEVVQYTQTSVSWKCSDANLTGTNNKNNSWSYVKKHPNRVEKYDGRQYYGFHIEGFYYKVESSYYPVYYFASYPESTYYEMYAYKDGDNYISLQRTTGFDHTYENNAQIYYKNQTYSLAPDVPDMAKSIVTAISADATEKNIEHYVRIIGFSEESSSTVLSDWTTSSTEMTAAISGASATTASVTPSPQTGLNAVASRSGSTNKQVVVMITDGSRWTSGVTKPAALNDATIYCVNTSSSGLDGTHAGYLNSLSGSYANSVPSGFPPTDSEQVATGGADYSLLGSNAKIQVTIGDGFTLPSTFTTSCIKKSVACNGASSNAPTFGNSPQDESEVTVSQSNNVVTIKGFDFSDNWCGLSNTTPHGKKLIVTFPVATTVSNTGGSAKTVVNTVTVTNQSSQPVTGLTPSTATLDLPNLTIQVSGVNANDNCIFTVSGTAGSSWNKTFTVMTHGTTPVKLQALPAGTYTITPKSWPWTYNLPDPKNNVTLSGAGRTETFTFTPKTITTPHHGEASASTPAN